MPDIVKRTTQYMDNLSFDETYEQNAVEILVENTAGTALVRQKEIATEAKQADNIAEINKIVGFEIGAYDEIDLTYVASGNGAGKIETAVYSTTGTPHTTLTLTYNSDNEISNVTKS